MGAVNLKEFERKRVCLMRSLELSPVAVSNGWVSVARSYVEMSALLSTRVAFRPPARLCERTAQEQACCQDYLVSY